MSVLHLCDSCGVNISRTDCVTVGNGTFLTTYELCRSCGAPVLEVVAEIEKKRKLD